MAEAPVPLVSLFCGPGGMELRFWQKRRHDPRARLGLDFARLVQALNEEYQLEIHCRHLLACGRLPRNAMLSRRSFKSDERFYCLKLRPSGHDISRRFADNNGGAIPSNLLQIPNTESNSPYLRHCATGGVKPHPARFPEKLPTFFIEFLTDPGDTVLDIFAGSNTAGSAAEKRNRRWLAFEKDRTYLATSAYRFVYELPAVELARLWSRLHSDELPVAVNRQQRKFLLRERADGYASKPKRKGVRAV